MVSNQSNVYKKQTNKQKENHKTKSRDWREMEWLTSIYNSSFSESKASSASTDTTHAWGNRNMYVKFPYTQIFKNTLF